MIDKLKKEWDEFNKKPMFSRIVFFIKGAAFIVPFLYSAFFLITNEVYIKRCENFYGLDSIYFDGKSIIVDKLAFLFLATLLLVYPYLVIKFMKRDKSIFKIILCILFSSILLFLQTLIYNPLIAADFDNNNIKKMLCGLPIYVYIIICLISAIALIILFDLNETFIKSKVTIKFLGIVSMAVLVLQISTIVYGISLQLKFFPENIKSYSLINTNKVVVSEYKGNFVVMECKDEIEGKDRNLYIKKGSCEMMEISGCNIERKTFNNVSCDSDVIIPEK